MNETVKQIIQNATAAGRASLSEHDSKQVIADFGAPTAPERLTHSAQEALDAAAELGYPVALKACSPDARHKKEMRLVELALADEAAVRVAYQQLEQRAAGISLEGILVQPMVRGERELLLGMTRVTGFGVCVTVGLGGIFAEALKDVAVRVAPLDEADARDMLAQLRGAAVLGALRGLVPADTGALVRALMGLGRLGLEHSEIKEVDVNPIIIGPDGSVAAVDALVILETSGGAA